MVAEGFQHLQDLNLVLEDRPRALLVGLDGLVEDLHQPLDSFDLDELRPCVSV